MDEGDQNPRRPPKSIIVDQRVIDEAQRRLLSPVGSNVRANMAVSTSASSASGQFRTPFPVGKSSTTDSRRSWPSDEPLINRSLSINDNQRPSSTASSSSAFSTSLGNEDDFNTTFGRQYDTAFEDDDDGAYSGIGYGNDGQYDASSDADQMSGMDTEQFPVIDDAAAFVMIDAVRKYPPIWDLSDKGHQNRLVVKNCWTKVVDEVHEKTGKQFTMQQLHARWTNIRKNRKKKPPTGSAARERHTKYGRMLTFLDTKNSRRQTITNLPRLNSTINADQFSSAEHSAESSSADVSLDATLCQAKPKQIKRKMSSMADDSIFVAAVEKLTCNTERRRTSVASSYGNIVSEIMEKLSHSSRALAIHKLTDWINEFDVEGAADDMK